ncbi:MAG: hypothetical protein JSU94_05475 [Phycisphaerales bacterium]|nr:MAG: hypothetical protein JSU94_05475 [Phycisphaerales bacterium]
MRTAKPLIQILALLTACSAAHGMFVMPTYAPVERLIKNATAYIKENPKDPHGYYTLARIHYLAFANGAALAATISEGTPPAIAPHWMTAGLAAHRLRSEHAMELTLQEFGFASSAAIPEESRRQFNEARAQKLEQLEREGWLPEKLTDKEAAGHAASAIDNFNKAIELRPKNGLYHLGLASLLDQYVAFLAETAGDTVPRQFRTIILERARESYYTAYSLSRRQDLAHRERPIAGLGSLVAYEAGKAYIRLSQAGIPLSRQDKSRISGIQTDLRKFEKLPFGAITPLIFTLEPHTSLSELLAPARSVAFDLDGDGRIERWPWVRPTTAILAWDPARTGSITSGRQLFGSVSWWLFFEDGYHALDALDDNRDGVIAGPELLGIAVWLDRNSNAKSDPGEVVPVEQTQIQSLAARACGTDRRCPMNPAGLTLKNGRTLPTYDWIAYPLKPRLTPLSPRQCTD